MTTYEKQLRSLLEDAIRSRAHYFNDCLHYDAAKDLLAKKFPNAEIDIVLVVLNALLREGILWL